MMKGLTTLESCVIGELIESRRRCIAHMKEGSMLYLHEVGFMYGIIEVYKIMKLWS